MTAITPVRGGSTKKASTASSQKKKQATIFSFFSKASAKTEPVKPVSPPNSSFKESSKSEYNQDTPNTTIDPENETPTRQSSRKSKSETIFNTPLQKTESNYSFDSKSSKHDGASSQPQLSTPANSSQENSEDENASSSPLSRSGRRKVNYSELSDDEEDELPVKSKRRKQSKVVESDLEDDFVPDEFSDDDEDLAEDLPDPKDIDEDDEVVVHDELDRLLDEHEKSTSPDVAGAADSSENADQGFILDDDEPVKQKAFKPNKTKNSKSSLVDKYNANSTYVATQPKAQKAKKSKSPEKDSPAKSFKKQNEERYQWLVTIRDAERRLETDPNYDPRTLYIPSSAWAKFTAFEKQYWEIKSKMWNSIVFFKKGKFYELYEKDAMLGHSLFDLKLANTGRANMQLAGIPEMSFDYWASEFIKKGFKVAKVDQKETLLAKEMKDRDAGKKEAKVIQRELSCVLTGGTLTQDGMLSDDMATYCLAVKQNSNRDGSNIFGVSFIDTATGAIRLLEFNDDAECTNLETLVNQIKPKEIIVEKNNLSTLATKIIKFNSAENFLWNTLKPETEFWDCETTVEEFSKAKYFEAEDLDDRSHWPPVLLDYAENKCIGFSSFGGLLWYLRSLKLDHDLVSIGNIEQYDIYKSISTLILDGQTLQNLEIFNNAFDGTDKGTLFKLINRAVTPFGKRMLKTWVCHPLLDISAINQRLDSVDGLLNDGNLMELLSSSLRSLPDLERMLSRIHSGNLRIKDFARVIDSFDNIKKLVAQMNDEYGSVDKLPGALAKYFQTIPNSLGETVDAWENAFDHTKAIDEDLLIPEPGVEEDFDASLNKQNELEKQLNTLLRDYKRHYKSQEICYRDSGKEIYLIEVPMKIVKKIPKDWVIMGSTSKVKRYWSPEVKEIVQELMETRELHKVIVENLKSKFYSRFDANYSMWLNTVKAIANIDCIISLALTSESFDQPSCRPDFIESNMGQVDFEELRHPCFIGGGVSGTKEFIPNDVNLGGDNANLGLLTGANAAGKSTVLRMTCVAVILAQLGCHVPAISAKLTPIDRIMTRLGANDNIMQGKSTFLVELSETKRILESATPKSLLVLDELGRGGSSSDGFAIAEAVLHHIATHIQSIGFFATHYASLGLPFQNHPAVKPKRMAILVDENSRNVTFLYKLEDGAAAGSFGMNVASMCGINASIIDQAEIAANELEHTSRIKKSNELAHLSASGIPLGLQSDIAWLIRGGLNNSKSGTGEGCRIYDDEVKSNVLTNIFSMIEGL